MPITKKSSETLPVSSNNPYPSCVRWWRVAGAAQSDGKEGKEGKAGRYLSMSG
jgi:hypothetical protein